MDTPASTSGNKVPLLQPNEGPGAVDGENEPGSGNPSGVMIEDNNVPGGRKSRSKAVQGFCNRGPTPPRTLELTMFERLELMFGSAIKRMLTVQYRYVDMHSTRTTSIFAIGQDAHKDSRIPFEDHVRFHAHHALLCRYSSPSPLTKCYGIIRRGRSRNSWDSCCLF